MKVREVLLGREYPENRAALRQQAASADEIAIIDAVERWHELRPDIEADVTPIALQLDRFARALATQLETMDGNWTFEEGRT
jgi:hypothetical protein